MIAIRQLSLTVGARMLAAPFDLTVGQGQVWGIIGANGCGKSTLLATLAGLRRPDAGDVVIDGTAVHALDALQRAAKLALLPQQDAGDYWGTVLDYVTLGRFPHQRSWLGPDADDARLAGEALDAMGLASLASRRYATLSGGERQRARIAQVLAQQPSCYLLDEPLQHLDVRHQAGVMHRFTALAAQGAAVLAVLHDLYWLSACTHVLVFEPGGCVSAGSAGSHATRERLGAAFGCDFMGLEAGNRRFFVPDVQ